jgi:hypothetical protein
MRNVSALLFAVAAFSAGMSQAQTPPATGKAIQPGLREVTGPRVNEAIVAGIEKITATPAKGRQSIAVHSPWGDSFYGWPKNVKPVAFTIEVGKPAGSATINAPGFKEADKADYQATIEAVVRKAIAFTKDSRQWMEGSGGG